MKYPKKTFLFKCETADQNWDLGNRDLVFFKMRLQKIMVNNTSSDNFKTLIIVIDRPELNQSTKVSAFGVAKNRDYFASVAMHPGTATIYTNIYGNHWDVWLNHQCNLKDIKFTFYADDVKLTTSDLTANPVILEIVVE